jgi:hypothetical protein
MKLELHFVLVWELFPHMAQVGITIIITEALKMTHNPMDKRLRSFVIEPT